MKVAAAYIRVSTEDQIEYSPESQLTEIGKYAGAHGFVLPRELVFVDEGISGKSTAGRPAFGRMIGAAKQKPRPFDAILLWKFSRFARNRQDSIVYKSMLRRELGIEVISISEPIGDDKMSILFEAMIEAMDEYYSINLAEEVRRGMTQRVRAGGHNTYAPFGYLLEDKNLIPDRDAAALVEKLFRDYLGGASIGALVQSMNALGARTRFGNPFDRRNVEYILKNPAYAGRVRWTPSGKARRGQHHPDTIVAGGTHPPLITAEVFDAVQAKLARQRRAYGPYRRADGRAFLLKGLVKCSCCAGTLVSAAAGKSLQCHNYAKGKCATSHSVTLAAITDAVLEQIAQDLGALRLSIQCTEDAGSSVAADQAVISRQTERTQLRLERVREAYEAGIDTLEEYSKNRRRIEAQLAGLHNLTVPPQDAPAPIDEREVALAQNRILSAFVQKIIFDRKKGSFTTIYHAL